MIPFPIKTADTLRWKELDTIVFILDLASGSYYALDSIGSFIWQSSLISEQQVEVVDALVERFEIDHAAAANDVAAFIDTCKENRFLQDSVSISFSKHRAPKWRLFLVMRAWTCLVFTVLGLKVLGFPRIYRRLALLLHSPSAPSDTKRLLAGGIAAFEMAENFFLMNRAPKDCLPRSLALYRFLISIGVEAEHCIGIHRFPFTAHAWVEHHGVALDNEVEKTDHFVVLSRLRS